MKSLCKTSLIFSSISETEGILPWNITLSFIITAGVDVIPNFTISSIFISFSTVS